MKYVFIFVLVSCIVKLHKCLPHNSTVISKYAKVAVWGNNKTNSENVQERRNISNKRIWNHRSDSKSISSNTKKNNPSVAYQYPVYQGPESKIDKRVEHIPGIGEVIIAQDRFEARPLFAYRNKQPSGSYGAPSVSNGNPSVTFSPPKPQTAPQRAVPSLAIPESSSFSSYLPPSSISDSSSSESSYNSPYSSYNPPDFKPDSSDSNALYPPNLPSSDNGSNLDSSVPPPVDQSYGTESAKSNKPNAYDSFGPPLAPYSNDENSHDHGSPHVNPAPHDPTDIYKNQDGPPDFPPKSEDDIYYPPDFPKDQVSQHDMKVNGGNMMISPPQSGDAVDIPPVSHDYDHRHAFPQYLYDNHHYDHQVYEEIPHTTEPAKEHKRVSNTHYSYYYLGRKLWYIPLYFSVYFIIYVTVLILKSIARHKVRLKYKWYEHDYNAAKQSRSLDLDSSQQEKISEVHHNISIALNNATKKYEKGLAM